jgi:hypothetical protein
VDALGGALLGYRTFAIGIERLLELREAPQLSLSMRAKVPQVR